MQSSALRMTIEDLDGGKLIGSEISSEVQLFNVKDASVEYVSLEWRSTLLYSSKTPLMQIKCASVVFY
jgi:hypothetical protein